MNTIPHYEKSDIIINFRDMLAHILRRWCSILVGVLLIALLAGGYRYMTDRRAYKNALAAENSETATIQLEGMSLANANQVCQYQKIYAMQAEYNRTAPLMQIDSSAVDTRVLSYYITGNEALLAGELYLTHLNNVALYEEIAQQITPQYIPSHLMELVTATLQYDTNAEVAAQPMLLKIKIIAPSQQTCNTITTAIMAKMASLKNDITTALGGHTLKLVDDTTQLNSDLALRNTQQNNLNNGNNLRNSLNSAKDALSSDELAYVAQMTAIDNQSEDSPAPTPPSVSVKMLILGFALGVVLMVGVHALGYVFSQTLKSREDFAERYGLFIFGNLAQPTAKRPSLTKRLIHRLVYGRPRIDAAQATALAKQQLLLAAREALTAEQTLLLTGSVADDTTAELFAPLADTLAKDGIRLAVLPCPVYNADALAQLATADAVVLAETIDKSTYETIYHELDLCERLARPILGAFIIG